MSLEILKEEQGKVAINIGATMQMLAAMLVAILVYTAQGIKADVKQLQIDVAQIRLDMQKVTYHDTRLARIEERLDRLKVLPP